MKLLLTINENDFEPQDYILRKVVRSIILDESKSKVLFFGSLLVGGGVEEGETDEEAVAREAMEEVGAKVEIIRQLGEVVAYRDFLKKKYVVHGYLCNIVGDLETPTSLDPEEKETKATWVDISTAIKRLESEIATIESERLRSTDQDDLGQRRSHNRKTSLVFLKEISNNL